MDNLLHGTLLNALLWDQSHNFNDLIHDFRNVLNIVTSVLPSGRNHRISPFLRTSVNFLHTCRHRVCQKHKVLSLITRVPERDILITSANVKLIIADVDSTGNVRTLLVDADSACLPPSDRHRIVTSCEVVNLLTHCLARGTELREPIRSIFLLCLYSKNNINRLRLAPNSREVVWPPHFLYLGLKM